MIWLRNLGKKFNSTFVVESVNLKISQGEIVGLLGPNGAGKTTTLRMIAGVLPPSQGEIIINNLSLKDHEGELKKLIGFLPENNPLYDEMTTEEYLEYWMRIKNVPEEEKTAAIDFVVESCGISEVFYRTIGELSKGFRQRVGLSQAILTKPSILILDEPTEGLDPNQRQDIASLIQKLGKQRTVIISSHVLPELAKIVNRMIVIHKGKVVADQSPENLRKMGSKTTTIEAEIKGEKVITTLKALSGIKAVKNIKQNLYEIVTNPKEDLREKIFKTAVSKKWIILTLSKKERNIEEVFSQLTSS